MSADAAPPFPKALQNLDQRLRDEGYTYLGTKDVQVYQLSLPKTIYGYQSPDSTFAFLQVFLYTHPLLELITHFPDKSEIRTSFPTGENISTDYLIARHAVRDPVAALRHYHAAVEQWTRQKGDPMRLETLADEQAVRDHFARTHHPKLYKRLMNLSLLRSILLVISTLIFLVGGPQRTEIAVLFVLVAVLMQLFSSRLQKPAAPLDASEAR